MGKKPLIVFDMDGVLIDVTGSYRDVVRLSVIYYLREVIDVPLPDKSFLTLSDIALIKRSGGLNNDWDLTYTILHTYLQNAFRDIDREIRGKLLLLKEIDDDHTVLEAARDILKSCDLSPLESLVQKKNILKLYERAAKNSREWSPFLINHGNVCSGNIAKRIFQEIYLGVDLFRQIYGESSIFYRNSGYINREKLIPSAEQLHSIFVSHTLSIATGRPEIEADYALERFEIKDLFTAVVSEDDIVQAERGSTGSLRKPHPFSIALCAEKSGYKSGDQIYYIGDMPDDMAAAAKAGAVPIGFVNSETQESSTEQKLHRALLSSHGAHHVFGNFQELSEYFV